MPVRNSLARKRGAAKEKISEKRKAVMRQIERNYDTGIEVKAALIQELIPLGLCAVAEELQAEVRKLAGEKYAHGGDIMRWGRQNGSVYLREEKFPISIPRLRNKTVNEEVQLETYQRLQQPLRDDKNTVLKLLHGLSTHKYKESSSLAAEAFGVSASNLSGRFKIRSAQSLRQLQERSLRGYDIVAIFVDGKRYAEDEILLAIGVTLGGDKIVLGIEQVHTENAKAVEQWLEHIIERGLKFEDGILFIIDGAKGIRTAIERRLKTYAVVQRCQWHKRENVLAYLDDTEQEVCRRRMKEAYAETTYKEAKNGLDKLHQELLQVNESAARSLQEGLEETLTLHQLGLAPELAKSLATTNCIESVMSQLGQYTDKVDRWHNSGQILRWTAASLLDIEPRLYKVKGFRYLKILRLKLREIVMERQGITLKEKQKNQGKVV